MPEIIRDGAASFKENAPEYLRVYPSILSAPQGIEAKIDSFEWRFNPGDPATRDWLRCGQKNDFFADIQAWSDAALCKGAREIQIVEAEPRGTDAGVRYLPYQENKLTYMQLDATARWVFTGPIEGCFVYVVTHDGNIYLFHVNANTVLDPHENAKIKDTKLRDAVNSLLPSGVITHRLSRADYAPSADDPQPFRGFVYGQRKAEWEFRYHSFIINGAEPIPLHSAQLPPDGSGMLA